MTRLGAVDAVKVSRRPSEQATFMKCYWDVADAVVAMGGDIQFGWLVLHLPHVALLAWHHAVWRQPTGELLDISPHIVTGVHAGVSLIVFDPAQTYALDWPPAMPQVFEPLSNDAGLAQFIDCQAKVDMLRRDWLQRLRSVPGARYCHAKGQVVTSSDHPDAVAQLNQSYAPKVAAAEEARHQLLLRLVELQQSVS